MYITLEGIFVIFRTRDVLLSLSTPLSASAYDIWAYETRQTRTGLQFCLSAQSYPGVKCAAESPSGEFLYDTPGLLSPNIIRLYPAFARLYDVRWRTLSNPSCGELYRCMPRMI